MKVIAIATIKGGVGKTILAGHLAAALARKGHHTLLMDLDPQGHSTMLAGVDVDADACCVGDSLLRASEILLSDVIVHDVRPNLDVAPAILKMAVQERQLYAWALRLKTVLRALQSLDDKPEAVVIDCPPHIGGFTEAALHAADLTLAPIPALAGSLRGYEDLQTTWSEMRDGRPGQMAGVINMWDVRTSVTNATILQSMENANLRVLNTRIPKAEMINQSALSRTFLFDFAPHHPAVLVFERLAEEVWDTMEQAQSEEDWSDSVEIAQESGYWRADAWPLVANAYLPTGTYSIREG